MRGAKELRKQREGPCHTEGAVVTSGRRHCRHVSEAKITKDEKARLAVGDRESPDALRAPPF